MFIHKMFSNSIFSYIPSSTKFQILQNSFTFSYPILNIKRINNKHKNASLADKLTNISPNIPPYNMRSHIRDQIIKEIQKNNNKNDKHNNIKEQFIEPILLSK